jgi:hypothetical protein
MFERFRTALALRLAPEGLRTQLAKVTARVDDSPGWIGTSDGRHDYDGGTIIKLYQDALAAYRKNPIALRIIGITTDFVIGDQITISSPNPALNAFIMAFWNHEKNRMQLRLEAMCDELSRAGDLFPVLFRNEHDGMSYLRFVTKDTITKIESDPSDWETELKYCQTGYPNPRDWLSPHHPDAEKDPAIMLHYSVNRPLGSLLGESDLTTMIPWLQRYSRMLEDRVRLHWSIRAFLWMVTVPSDKVKEKREQYRSPPDAGTVIVKDSTETWEAVTPMVRGADAQPDMAAVRNMIGAGSGYPQHYFGEAGDANLATANAMGAPTIKHVLRRQQYFSYMLCDILYCAYQRAVQIGKQPALPSNDYGVLFNVNAPALTREDNESLGRAARGLARAFQSISEELPGPSDKLARLMLKESLKYAGLPQSDGDIDAILAEAKANQKVIWTDLREQFNKTAIPPGSGP